MIEAEVTVGAVESANKQEAWSIIVPSEKHEEDTDGGVSKWRKDNGKWLRKRKRVKKTEVLEERVWTLGGLRWWRGSARASNHQPCYLMTAT